MKSKLPVRFILRSLIGSLGVSEMDGGLTSRTVLLQAMKAEPPSDTRCRDKFLVQSIPITGDKEFTNVQQIVRPQTCPFYSSTRSSILMPYSCLVGIGR